MIYWSDIDNKFIVEVFKLSDCMTYGNTAEEVFKNVEIVISEWIETVKEIGREMPKAKGKLMFA